VESCCDARAVQEVDARAVQEVDEVFGSHVTCASDLGDAPGMRHNTGAVRR